VKKTICSPAAALAIVRNQANTPRMGHVAYPDRSLDRPECCKDRARCSATAVRVVSANPLGACDATPVTCALADGHPGPHMSEPAPCRSLLGRRRWLVTQW
jgi:hypothetical protein